MDLYPECPIREKISKRLILATSLRHAMPDIGLENVLKLVDCHLPSAVHKSKYKLLKSFKTEKGIDYYYCDSCMDVLKFNENEEVACDICEKAYKKKELRDSGHYFLTSL